MFGNSMKKNTYVLSVLLVLMVLLCVSGCRNEPESEILSGTYYAVGDYNQPLVPYVEVNTEDRTISIGMGDVVDYAERGSFKIKGNKLTAETQNGNFNFIIIDNKTLRYIDNSVTDFILPSNMRFVLDEKH